MHIAQGWKAGLVAETRADIEVGRPQFVGANGLGKRRKFGRRNSLSRTAQLEPVSTTLVDFCGPAKAKLHGRQATLPADLQISRTNDSGKALPGPHEVVDQCLGIPV